ncbi:MAG TPA: hypothetical protein VIS95_01090 [Solirubrobacterales bacterium]
MKVLAEIPSRPSAELRTGTLRRGDLEAFRGLLERLAGARAVLVAGDTAARQQVAAGLAAAAAAEGTRTALLECDLERPGLADALGLAGAPGLGEYLRGDAEAEAILKPVVPAGPGSAAAEEPLVCVVAGRPAADAERLLASERFRHAVSSLRATYELLVLDGPPPGRDAELLAAMAVVDATVAVVDGADAAPSLPAPVAGLVVQRS